MSLPTEEELEQALAELGPTRRKIGNKLKALNITGRPSDVCRCPVANYLKFKFGVGYVAVMGNITIAQRLADREYHSVDTPKPISDFMTSFDNGNWPTLVAEDI